MYNRPRLSSQSGKSLVELILWLPVLFFILFAITDISLYFRDTVVVSDALRGGLNSEFLYNLQSSVLSLQDGEDVEVSSVSVEKLGHQLLGNFHESLKAKLNQGPLNGDSSNEQFFIQLGLIELNIDQNTGQLRSFSAINHHFFEAGDFSLKESLETAERIIDGNLSNDETPSRYAVLSGLDYALLGADANQRAGTRYLSKGVVCFARIALVPRSIAPALTSSVLGRRLIVEEREFRLLRVPMY